MLEHHSEGPPWLSAKDREAWQSDRSTLSEAWRKRDGRSFEEFERHLQYGYGAARYFGQQPWDDKLEKQLQSLWPEDWEADKAYIRMGWDWGREEAPQSN